MKNNIFQIGCDNFWYEGEYEFDLLTKKGILKSRRDENKKVYIVNWTGSTVLDRELIENLG